MYVDREKALEQGEKLNVVGGPAWRTGFPHETVCCHEGRGGHFCPEISRQACWRAKMPTPARRAAYCWVRKTSAECRATKYWRYFSIAKELSLSKYTSFPWFYWIRDFVTLQNTVFLIAKSGKEIKFLSPCYARRKRKKLGTHKQLQMPAATTHCNGQLKPNTEPDNWNRTLQTLTRTATWACT